MVKIRDMATQTARRLASSVLGLIPEKHIAGPEFGISKGG
jgi:hypothetical protein